MWRLTLEHLRFFSDSCGSLRFNFGRRLLICYLTCFVTGTGLMLGRLSGLLGVDSSFFGVGSDGFSLV